MLQLRRAARQHDAVGQLVAESRIPDLLRDVFGDVAGARFDHHGQVVQQDILGLLGGASLDAHHLVFGCQLGDRRTEFAFEAVHVAFEDAQRADVVVDRPPPMGMVAM